MTDSDDGIAAAGCHDTRGVVLMNYIAPSHRLKGISKAMLAHLEIGTPLAVSGHDIRSGERSRGRRMAAMGTMDD